MKKNLYQFHVHTCYSCDCMVSLKDLYKTLVKNQVTGVAITDHNTIKGALEFKRRFGDKIDVIIGEEIMTSQGEVIGLFLREEIKSGLTFEQTVKEIKKQRGIVYIPHPFDEKRKKTCVDCKLIEQNKVLIDFIEVFNGRCVDKKFNKKADKLCKSLGLLEIYGSDAHSRYELKYNLVNVFADKLTKENIKENLLQSKHIKEKINIKIHEYTKLVRIIKLIKRGSYGEVFNLISRKCKKRLQRIIRSHKKE